MRVVLFVLSALSFVSSIASFGSAKSVMHQILGAIEMLSAAVLLCAGCLLGAIRHTEKRLSAVEKKATEQLAEISKLSAIAIRWESAASKPPLPDGPKFWVKSGDDTTGPFPISTLRQLKDRGTIDDETPIAREGGSDWKRAASVLHAGDLS